MPCKAGTRGSWPQSLRCTPLMQEAEDFDLKKTCGRQHLRSWTQLLHWFSGQAREATQAACKCRTIVVEPWSALAGVGRRATGEKTKSLVRASDQLYRAKLKHHGLRTGTRVTDPVGVLVSNGWVCPASYCLPQNGLFGDPRPPIPFFVCVLELPILGKFWSLVRAKVGLQMDLVALAAFHVEHRSCSENTDALIC